MRIPPMPRLLGLLTLGYGAYTAARPQSLAHAAELEPRHQPLSRSGEVLGAVIDVVGFGLASPTRGARAKVVGIAAGWGLLCAASYPAAKARRP